MFKPFAAKYTRMLNVYLLKSQGLLPLTKRDFFELFWDAWITAFRKPMVLKTFGATGISPPDPSFILRKFNPSNSDSSDNGHESSSESNLSNWNQISRRLKSAVRDTDDRMTR